MTLKFAKDSVPGSETRRLGFRSENGHKPRHVSFDLKTPARPLPPASRVSTGVKGSRAAGGARRFSLCSSWWSRRP